jgi:hypothetical protein
MQWNETKREQLRSPNLLLSSYLAAGRPKPAANFFMAAASGSAIRHLPSAISS